MSTINVTVDTNDYNALTRASDMLHGMAQDAKNGGGIIDPDKEKVAKEVLIDSGFIDPKHPLATPASTTPPPPPPANPAAPIGVELDSDGLPWDSRIHGGKHLKTKKDAKWKLIRGIDPALVTTVEAELRAAMAIPAGSTVTHTPENANTASVTPNTPLGAVVDIPPPPAQPAAGAITTFPELMAKLTPVMAAGTITEATIQQVLNKHGLASLPLLISRPDLIPAVDAELFPAV